eukprot:GEZU01012355.1.p1 GENE.GEZU01012355.1~~GEZU01012355.1.p1  ORF type:complete len:165 (-),score=3.70 GEZU01012355.1:30-464(-)
MRDKGSSYKGQIPCMASSIIYALLFVVAIAHLSSCTIKTTEAVNHELCICSCCRDSDCMAIPNGTVQVSGCHHCTKDFCQSLFQTIAPCEANNFQSVCINRDGWFAKAVVFFFLGITSFLVIFGCAMEFLPIPAVRKFNEKYFK